MENFRPDLMEVVAAWVRGVKFAELAKMTSIFEVGVGRGGGRCVGLGLGLWGGRGMDV